ncbi:MAG: hypothetical protein AB4042_00125 [Leptolyngbyaceae cyanobacterium]
MTSPAVLWRSPVLSISFILVHPRSSPLIYSLHPLFTVHSTHLTYAS